MTDNEIIKAFIICKESNWCCDESCPFFENCNSQIMAKYALDLINRQEAEIGKWQKEYKRACAERDAHICTNEFIRNEAIKEFAERLKENFLDLKAQTEGKRKTVPVEEYIMQSNWLLHTVAIQVIDDLVKEMTEGKDNA